MIHTELDIAWDSGLYDDVEPQYLTFADQYAMVFMYEAAKAAACNDTELHK